MVGISEIFFKDKSKTYSGRLSRIAIPLKREKSEVKKKKIASNKKYALANMGTVANARMWTERESGDRDVKPKPSSKKFPRVPDSREKNKRVRRYAIRKRGNPSCRKKFFTCSLPISTTSTSIYQLIFRTPLTPGGNIALPPAGAPQSRDGGPGSYSGSFTALRSRRLNGWVSPLKRPPGGSGIWRS